MNESALAQLGDGGVVAAATETFFGLLVDATRTDAIERLYQVKPRTPDKGMPVLLPSRTAWASLVQEIPPLAARLADAFWPGPLTIGLPALPDVDPRLVLDGTIAVRLPASSPAADLARELGRPLSATSANHAGEPAATSSRTVRACFADAVSDGRLVVVDGWAPGGAPSTVVVIRGDHVRLVRAGAIQTHRLEAALGAPLE